MQPSSTSAENGFYIFKGLLKKKRKKTREKKKKMRNKEEEEKKKKRRNGDSVECSLQSLKYLPSNAFQKPFADLWWK